MSDFSETATNDEFTFFFGEDEQVAEETYNRPTALDGRHRCDANAKGTCRAQVLVVSTVTQKDLLLCAHHFAKASAKLADQGFTVAIDQRDDLTAKEDKEVHA